MGFVRALRRLNSCFFPLANKSDESLCRADESVHKPISIRSDKSLLLAVESAIKVANEPVKEEFPYKIHVQPYTTGIKLTREYYGETINVKTHVYPMTIIFLDVEISRKSGNCLRFECWNNSPGNSIGIKRLEVKSKESSSKVKHEFAMLDENLQKALVKYLDVRGINLSMIKLIEDHWKKDESKMNKLCLEKLEEFFEKE